MKLIGRNIKPITAERHESVRSKPYVKVSLAYGFDLLLDAKEAFDLADQLVDAAESQPPVKGTQPNQPRPIIDASESTEGGSQSNIPTSEETK